MFCQEKTNLTLSYLTLFIIKIKLKDIVNINHRLNNYKLKIKTLKLMVPLGPSPTTTHMTRHIQMQAH